MPETTLRISKSFAMPGYILDSKILRKVDDSAKQALVRGRKKNCITKYRVKTRADKEQEFESFASLSRYLDTDAKDLNSIVLEYSFGYDSGIDLAFKENGFINLSAYSTAIDFQLKIDRLIQEIQAVQKEYNWFIQNFIFKRNITSALLSAMGWLSVILLYSVLYYLYARNVGINIDPALIPNGNQYFQQVESAIRSDDINEKLDVLLISQLRAFTNVEEVLARQERYAFYLIIALTVVGIFFFVYKYSRRLYPFAIFDFLAEEKLLANIYHKREILWIGIMLGFVINLIAGILITLID